MTLGVLFAILASASFGFNIASVRRGVATGAALQGLYLTVFPGFLLFLLAAALSGQLMRATQISIQDYWLLIIGGVVHILIGRYCNYRAVSAIGANRSSPIVAMSTLVTVGVAILFLGETLSTLNTAGILFVMLGPPLATGRPSSIDRVSRCPDSDSRRRMLEGYLWGLAAAVFWGIGPVFMRAGVATSGMGVMGGFITYLAATAVLLPVLLFPGQMSGALGLDRGARMWFLVAGFNSFLANLFRFSALALAPVSVIIPLMRTATVFGVGFNLLLNRSLESFEPRVLTGIGVSVAGAILVVL